MEYLGSTTCRIIYLYSNTRIYIYIYNHCWTNIRVLIWSEDFDGIRRYSSSQPPVAGLHDEQAVSFGKHPSIRGQGTVRQKGVEAEQQQAVWKESGRIHSEQGRVITAISADITPVVRQSP